VIFEQAHLYTTSLTGILKDLEKLSRYGILRDGIPQSLSDSRMVRYTRFSDNTVRYGIELDRSNAQYETVQFFCSTVSFWWEDHQVYKELDLLGQALCDLANYDASVAVDN
jgi:hypothetical protein